MCTCTCESVHSCGTYDKFVINIYLTKIINSTACNSFDRPGKGASGGMGDEKGKKEG